MKKLMVSVFDSKAESWSFPVQADNRLSAIRMFSDLVGDKRTLVGQYPEDFELYELGEFDVSSGDVVVNRLRIANGLDFKTCKE